MVFTAEGIPGGSVNSPCYTAKQVAEMRQAAKDCYCGLGPACCHWNEMNFEQRVACASDKRASAESNWKTGGLG
jgi:hypothetical protein